MLNVKVSDNDLCRVPKAFTEVNKLEVTEDSLRNSAN